VAIIADRNLTSQLALEERLIGARLGKYEIVEEVGYGGMSVVYRARDTVLEREVAIKVLHSHLSKRRDARIRFQREAQAVAKLRHPNIVEIYDYSSEESRRSYIVTEFIHGPTLRDFIDGRAQSFPEVGVMIAIQLGGALGHAHKFGVIHRDIKPENVMIRPDGVLKLMDFGIAHLIDAQTVTQTGSLLGSPAHMAPEVISGAEADVRSDIFSLGTVLYYLTTGQLPFQGRNAAQVLRSIAEGRYMDPEMRDPRIGQKLGAIIRRSMAKDPEARYEILDELLDDLREYIEEVDLLYVDRELRKYFTDPDDYEHRLRERVLTALEAGGREALEQRQIARAVDCFNRVLAIDDTHEGVRRLLGRLDRRRRLTAYGLAMLPVLIIAFAALVATGVFEPGRWFGDDEEEMAGAVTLAGDNVWGSVWVAEDAARRERELRGTARDVATARRERATRVALAVGAVSAGRAAALEVLRSNQLVRWNILVEQGVAALAALNGSERPPGEDSNGRATGSSDERVDASERDRDRRDRRDDADDGDDPGAPSRGEADAESERGDPGTAGEAEGTGERALAAATLSPIPVRFIPNPRSVDVSIDEGAIMATDAQGEFLLEPGEHRVTYSSPYTVTETFDIVVPAELPENEAYVTFRHVLEWRPARLRIDSDIPGLIIHEGHPLGHTDEAIEFEIPSDDFDGTVEITVRIVPEEGRGRIRERTFELQAGTPTVVEIQLSGP
jgi:tRNA A-37 threonylcarbamoyl transferase component Bud32